MLNYRLSDLPPFGKLFVGIFTSLMMLVCLWAVFIFYVEKGLVDADNLPDYLKTSIAYNSEIAESNRQADIEEISADSESVLAPIWDSLYAGHEIKADSASMAIKFREKDSMLAENVVESLESAEEEASNFSLSDKEAVKKLRENVGLAHTHINGQTLLFFCIGLVFLFTSVKPKIKKVVFFIFGFAVFFHAIGLSGEGFHWYFDDILALSGVVLLVIIPYMAFTIYIDLAKSSAYKIERDK